jgi:hypothetical protein
VEGPLVMRDKEGLKVRLEHAHLLKSGHATTECVRLWTPWLNPFVEIDTMWRVLLSGWGYER